MHPVLSFPLYLKSRGGISVNGACLLTTLLKLVVKGNSPSHCVVVQIRFDSSFVDSATKAWRNFNYSLVGYGG
jgi:hypothetical protein